LECDLTVAVAAGPRAMGDIWRAAEAGDVGEVERLVGQDPSLLDANTGRGRTPLIAASRSGHVGVVRWLLDRGAAMHERDGKGCTAIWWACLYGHPSVVAVLLERGADPTTANDRGETPLMGASACDRTEVVRHLLAHPSAAATINCFDRGGGTALYHACQCGSGEAVRLLLKHGADPTIANNLGTTPIAAAEDEITGMISLEGQRVCIEALKVRFSLCDAKSCPA
jgi:ankyrin repeat protein